jgi:hypothetical protein
MVTQLFWENLTKPEQKEFGILLNKARLWSMYVGQCNKDKIPVDYSKSLADDEWIRMDQLAAKVWNQCLENSP